MEKVNTFPSRYDSFHMSVYKRGSQDTVCRHVTDNNELDP